MPQLALPEIFELENERLELLGSRIALISEEVRDRVGVHLVWSSTVSRLPLAGTRKRRKRISQWAGRVIVAVGVVLRLLIRSEIRLSCEGSRDG
jgi:hypothetical protein